VNVILVGHLFVYVLYENSQ